MRHEKLYNQLETCGVNLFDAEKGLRFRFQLRKTPKLSIENERHLKYFTIELEAIHTQKDELTNEWKPTKSDRSDIKLFYLFYKAKNLKMNEKILTRKEFKKLIHENHESLTFVQKKKTAKSSERHFTHISLFNFSENLCNTCCLSFFFINMNNKVTDVWNSKTLSGMSF